MTTNATGRTDWGPMAQVRAGMHVVDAAGNEIGRVDMVRMGDPESATTAGNEEVRPGGPLDVVASALGAEAEPDVPEPLHSRLIRSGYLKLDGAGLLDADRYVPARYVREVAGDRVTLNVAKKDLAKEE